MNKIDEILFELKKLAKKDPIFAKDVESQIALLIDKDDKSINLGGKLISKVYEDVKMKQSVDKTNFIRKVRGTDSSYVSSGSKIGRISRKKALFDMTWVIKRNAHRLNYKELIRFVQRVEKKLIEPDDYDIMQTAKIRDEFIFIKNGILNFHTFSKEGKEIRKAIAFKDNSVIILGKNKIFRIFSEDREIESDNTFVMGAMPLDSVYYSKDNMVFVHRL